MRKRLTLDILGINDTDQNAIRELAIKHYGKPSISNLAKQLLCNALKENNKQSISNVPVVKIKKNRISFDQVVHTMNYTGQKIAMELNFHLIVIQ